MRNHHFPKPDAISNFFKYRYGNCMQTGFKLCVAASDLSSSISEVVVQKLLWNKNKSICITELIHLMLFPNHPALKATNDGIIRQ